MSSDRTCVEITGTFAQRRYRSDDSSYCVCIYSVKNHGFVTVVGSDLPEAEYPVTFSGQWATHPAYGEQFKADMVLIQLPTTRKEIISFITASSARISKRQAAAMVDHAGPAGFWDLLYKKPQEFYPLKKVGESKIMHLQEEVKRISSQRDLHDLFGSDLSMDNQQYHRICSLFSDNLSSATEQIRENPFVLIKAGYLFPDLDNYAAKRTTFCVNDYRRLLGATQHLLLKAQGQCHVGLPPRSLLAQLKDCLKKMGPVNETDCNLFLRSAASKGDIILSGDLYYLPQSYKEESAITRKLAAMAEIEPENISRKKFDALMSKYAKNKGFSLSPDQMNAVWTVLTRSVCVVTGGPGTGKSTILDAILYCWKHFKKDGDWLLMAPTGKASVRMTETTQQPAYTIHSTLQLGVASDTGESYADGAVDVKAGLVIVDEASMIDQSVAKALTSALANPHSSKQHFVLVGDPDQLPSVGYGNILADLIDSGVIPVCALHTIYRQAAGNPIITNSIRIREGTDELVWDHYFRRYHVGSDTQNAEALCTFYMKCVKQFGIENVVVLSPFRTKTEIGTNVLNRKLQDAINPNRGQRSVKSGNITFREGDRVMQLRNTEWLNNGDVGTVIRAVPSAGNGESCLTVAFENGIEQGYSKDDLIQLDLAYALSVHKSQGSQYPCVILALPNETSKFLQKNILYTAITRSSKCVAIFGPTATIRYMIHNEDQDVRYTQLALRLRTINEVDEAS